jgi:hypothetical protein
MHEYFNENHETYVIRQKSGLNYFTQRLLNEESCVEMHFKTNPLRHLLVGH